MKVVILGAGIIGVSSAWHLLQAGHEVTLVDRQSEAASETSFANAAQISVSYCEPWANKHAPLKALKWMFSDEAPLLFRPQFPLGKGWHQYSWGLQFLANCNDKAFERNVAQIVALGRYSQAALSDIVDQTDIEYSRLEKGIAHIFTDASAFEAAAAAAELMRRHGVKRDIVSTQELLRIEPAFKNFAGSIVGGTYTPSDESGDARQFTRELLKRCDQLGAQLLLGHDIVRLNRIGGAIDSVAVSARSTGVERTIHADAIVVACGSFSAPLLRSVGLSLPVYPGKGYSVTLPLFKPDLAPQVSTIDDAKKIAMTRLGNFLRVAGTIEVGGYDLSIDTPLAQKRCEMLLHRIEAILPGVADTRTPAQGGNPQYWAGLRPATPTNIPFIGQTQLKKLWVNTGHGTLGWTHGAGSGKAIAELISGRKPEMAFDCLGSQTSIVV